MKAGSYRMKTLEVGSYLVFASSLVLGCVGGRIHDVGDLDTGGSTGAIPGLGGATGETNSGVGGAGGSVSISAEPSGGTTSEGGSYGLGGSYGFGGTSFGGAATGGAATGGTTSTVEGVILFPAWSEFMSGTGRREFRAAIYNGSDRSIFVDPGCIGNWWKQQGDTLAKVYSSSFACINTIAGAQELPPSATAYSRHSYNLSATGVGIYQLQGEYWVGCTLAGTCAEQLSATSADVWVLSSAVAAPSNSPATGPEGLHVVCGENLGCPSGQTAIETYYSDNVGCTCEMPCDPAANTCPAGTACTYVSGVIGSLCQ